MNILILGTGYLGLAAGIFLQKKGHFITGTTRFEKKLPFIKEHLSNAFLLKKDNLIEGLQDQDIVLFTAGADSFDAYKETYLDNATAIINGSCKAPSLKQIIYTSSTSVYGDHQGTPVTELTALSPLSGQSKILVQTEKILAELPQSCIFRLGELIGEGRTIEERLRTANGAAFPGTGENITNFSPLSDVVRAIDFAIEKPLFGIYNLCSSLHAQRKQLYANIANAKKIPQNTWDHRSTSLHGGNKKVLSDKIMAAGFTFESLPWEGIVIQT